MSNQVQVKRSNVPGKLPTLAQVPAGALAMNTADAKLFFSTGDIIKALANLDDITWGNIQGKPTELSYLTGVTSSIQAQLNGKQASLGFTPENIANKNAANGYPGLDALGKLSTAVLPAIAISDTFVVANESAMLALTAQTGDVAVRTDLSKSFILKGTTASVLADWQELLTPTAVVTSVNGQTGPVTITDITGNAGTATKLQTARTLSVTGPATGSTSFDGSVNAAIALTLANDLTLPGTGGVKVPSGTTAQRIAENGRFRLNLDTGAYEGYYNGSWTSVTPLTLTNGYPAHYETAGNNLVSIDSVTYLFNTKTNGNKNIYLSIAGDIASNVNGYAIPMNALIYSITIQIGAAITAAMTFEIRKNPTGTVVASFTIPAGATTVHVNNIATLLNAGDEISCYINSTINVANPLAVIRMKWRN